VKGLEVGDSFVLVVQVPLNPLQLSRYPPRPSPSPPADNLAGPIVGEYAVISNSLRDLVEAALESTHPANTNAVLGCTASVLVVDGGILA
jgi:hypothetical protein